MSTHDYIIADASGSAFLADLNLAIKALAENNYSTTEPAVMYAHMWWADTTADILKKRNAANTGWISYLTLSTGALIGTAANSTYLSHQSEFYAYVGTTHAATSAGYTKVQLTTELFDVSTLFDSATNYRYTATVAGYYSFSWAVHINGSAANKLVYGQSYLYKNGAAYSEGSGISNLPTAAAVDNFKSSGGAVVHLSAGEYVELYVYMADITANGSVQQGASLSYLCGHMVSKD